MKKNIKLKKHPSCSSLYYEEEYCAETLNVLSLFISETSPERFINQINTPNSFGYDNEITTTDWSHKDNTVIIQIEDYYKLTNENNSFHLTLNNFKNMLEDWKKLEDAQAPKIYFIQQDNGSIIVQDHVK